MDKALSVKHHFVALVSAVGLHSGIAAWAMSPSEPVALPQQQVIQISMVAPTPIQEEVIETAVVEPAPVIPPKEEGLKKVQPEPEKQVEKKPVEEKKIQKVQHKSAPVTSGPQDMRATAKNAAITEPIFDAAYLQNPAPEYPEYARRRGYQGKVVLEVQVTRDGAAKEVNVASTSGFSVLDKAALSVVRDWKFVPARRGSEIVEARVLVPVLFRIN